MILLLAFLGPFMGCWPSLDYDNKISIIKIQNMKKAKKQMHHEYDSMELKSQL